MINVIKNNHKYEVWTDTEVAECDGRCLASNEDKCKALQEALIELENECEILKRLIFTNIPQP